MIFGSFAVVAFGVLLILVIVRELLPDRKQKRRRLGSDIRRINPETVDTPGQQEAPAQDPNPVARRCRREAVARGSDQGSWACVRLD